jgi:hypothetical protein
VTPFIGICSIAPRQLGQRTWGAAMDVVRSWVRHNLLMEPPPLAAVRALARRLARVHLVDRERDLIERLDRLDVATGNLRFAATSGSSEEVVAALVARLERASGGLLANDVRLVADDRPERLEDEGAPRFLVRAIAQRPAPLPLAFTWRAGEKPPPQRIARLLIGPLLGYPRCCVAFEEARRAAMIAAEGRGMVESWGARRTDELLLGIDERRPYLADEIDEEGRVARLRRFPFVSFVPCVRCCARGAKSPAGRENARREALAREVAPALAREIERVRGR